MCVPMLAEARKRELRSQMTVRCLLWLLGTEHRSGTHVTAEPATDTVAHVCNPCI